MFIVVVFHLYHYNISLMYNTHIKLKLQRTPSKIWDIISNNSGTHAIFIVVAIWCPSETFWLQECPPWNHACSKGTVVSAQKSLQLETFELAHVADFENLTVGNLLTHIRSKHNVCHLLHTTLNQANSHTHTRNDMDLTLPKERLQACDHLLPKIGSALYVCIRSPPSLPFTSSP